MFSALILHVNILSTERLSRKSSISLLPLQKKDISKIITAKFASYNKRLSKEQLDFLLCNADCSNLNWLVISCEEIRVFGVFETLTEHIASLPETIDGLMHAQLI